MLGNEDQIIKIISNKGSKPVKLFVGFLAFALLLIVFLSHQTLKIDFTPFRLILIYLFLILTLVTIYKYICHREYHQRKTITIDEVRNNGDSGDIILFKTYESYDLPEFIYYRLLLALYTGSDWSHVGLLVRCPESNRLYIWQSSETPSLCHMTNDMQSGVKLSDFETTLSNYNGCIGYRKIKKALSVKQKKNIWKTCFKYKNTPFRSTLFKQDKSQMNCAESVSQLLDKTKIYQTPNVRLLKLLPLKMLPCNFSSSCNRYSQEYWDDDKIIKRPFEP